MDITVQMMYIFHAFHLPTPFIYKWFLFLMDTELVAFYIVTSPLIAWVHTQNDPYMME